MVVFLNPSVPRQGGPAAPRAVAEGSSRRRKRRFGRAGGGHLPFNKERIVAGNEQFSH
jgi:hypothetical protein